MAHVRFDSEEHLSWVPSREWAQAWVEGARRYWPLVRADYRERVRKYYAEHSSDAPDAFPMMHPTSIVVVVSLLHAWVFAGPAVSDEVVVREMWEDPVLADWEALSAPNVEAQVRYAGGIDPEFRLIDEEEVAQTALLYGRSPKLDYWKQRRAPGLSMAGWDLADDDDRTRLLNEGLEQFRGRGIDRPRLRQLQAEYDELKRMPNRNARGLKLEPFVRELLKAHNFDVEKGKHRPGEQVDLFVHRPIRALVECRWEAAPVGAPAIGTLITKLTRSRPAIVSGVYVSMSGFTREAEVEAREHARERVVVLLGCEDVVTLLRGEKHALDLIDERIDELVRRYRG